MRLLMFHAWHLLWEVVRLAAYDFLSWKRSVAREEPSLGAAPCWKIEGVDLKGEEQGHVCAAGCQNAVGPLFETVREFCLAQCGAERNRGRVEGGAAVLCLICLTFLLSACCWIHRRKNGGDRLGSASRRPRSIGGASRSSSDGEAERARARARARSFSG